MTEPNDPLAPLSNSVGVGVMRYYLQQAGYPNVGDLDAFIRERDALCALLRGAEASVLGIPDADLTPEWRFAHDARVILRAIREEAP